MPLDPKNLVYVKKIGGHPVQRFLDQAIQESFSNKYMEDHEYRSVSWDDDAICYVEGGKIIAAMCFKRRDYDREIGIHWAFVVPERRRQGLHSLLISTMQAIAVRDGYSTVSRNCRVDNIKMRKAIEAQGGKLVFLTYDHYLGHDHVIPVNVEDRFTIPEDVTIP